MGMAKMVSFDFSDERTVQITGITVTIAASISSTWVARLAVMISFRQDRFAAMDGPRGASRQRS